MTKDEFLKKVGLGEADFRDLLGKFAAFEKTLNPAQLAAVQRSMRSRSEALRSLGGDVTSTQLTRVLKTIGSGGGPSHNPPRDSAGQFDGRSIFVAKVHVKKPKSED